jgi:hypothetical protein
MKRFFIFILSILYLSTSFGASINLHYCKDKLVDFSILAKKNKTCSNCGMEKKENEDNSCCKDEQKSKNAPQFLFHLQNGNVAIANSFYELQDPCIPLATAIDHFSHAPPRPNKIDSYILHCTFLI